MTDEQVAALQSATQHVAEACGILAGLLLAVSPRTDNVVPFPLTPEPVLPRVRRSPSPRHPASR